MNLIAAPRRARPRTIRITPAIIVAASSPSRPCCCRMAYTITTNAPVGRPVGTRQPPRAAAGDRLLPSAPHQGAVALQVAHAPVPEVGGGRNGDVAADPDVVPQPGHDSTAEAGHRPAAAAHAETVVRESQAALQKEAASGHRIEVQGRGHVAERLRGGGRAAVAVCPAVDLAAQQQAAAQGAAQPDKAGDPADGSVGTAVALLVRRPVAEAEADPESFADLRMLGGGPGCNEPEDEAGEGEGAERGAHECLLW